MKITTASLGALAIVASAFAATAAPPALIAPAKPSVATNIVDVGHRSDHRRGFYRHGQHHYYNGHRGHRHKRPGYRYHNGYWFPLAAFTAGAVVGGAIASRPRPAYGRYPEAHIQWCYDQYRSYRLSDNTFQPYQGPRQLCRSPYG